MKTASLPEIERAEYDSLFPNSSVPTEIGQRAVNLRFAAGIFRKVEESFAVAILFSRVDNPYATDMITPVTRDEHSGGRLAGLFFDNLVGGFERDSALHG
jgi:hypothetical protein